MRRKLRGFRKTLRLRFSSRLFDRFDKPFRQALVCLYSEPPNRNRQSTHTKKIDPGTNAGVLQKVATSFLMLLKVYQSRQQPSTILHKQENADFLRSCSPFPIRLFEPETTKFLHHLQLRLLLIVVLVFFAIRASPIRNSGSEYTVLSHKAGNRVPSRMCTRTWFRLIFTPCAFLLC